MSLACPVGLVESSGPSPCSGDPAPPSSLHPAGAASPAVGSAHRVYPEDIISGQHVHLALGINTEGKQLD